MITRPRLTLLVVVLGGLLAWLAFGFFEIQALLLDEVVAEPPPVASVPPGQPGGQSSAEPSVDDSESMGATQPGGADDPAGGGADEPATTAPVLRGSFVSRVHQTEGMARVVTDGSRRVLRLEDFRTDNGPDVNVYLSAAPADGPGGAFVEDFVDLGDLKGNVGDQNYELPDDLDLDRYSTVVIWCVRFSVVFGAAELA